MSREEGKKVDSKQAEKGLERESRGVTILPPCVALSYSEVPAGTEVKIRQSTSSPFLFFLCISLLLAISEFSTPNR